MKALGEHGFPVPVAVDSNRHAVLMTLMEAWPLVQIKELSNPGQVSHVHVHARWLCRCGACGACASTCIDVMHAHVWCMWCMCK